MLTHWVILSPHLEMIGPPLCPRFAREMYTLSFPAFVIHVEWVSITVLRFGPFVRLTSLLEAGCNASILQRVSFFGRVLG